MRKHKFNRPLTVAFSEKMYGDIKSLSDVEEVSMAQWVRESLSQIIETSSLDLDVMVSGKSEEVNSHK